MARHLIVISLDAFSEDNWEAACRLPNFARLISGGAYSTNLRSIYPTLTYAVHSTIVTGCYPDRHGVVHNNPLQPFVPSEDQAWYWMRSDIKVPAIYDAVKENGMQAAGIFWPVSGKASLRWNMPEIAAFKGENQALKILKNGNVLYCIRQELRHRHVRDGISQPGLDEFSALAAMDTIRRHKPNLLLLHQIEVDDAKHHAGTKSPEVQQALEHFDGRLGRILDTIQEAGIADETVVFVQGDHGQLDVRHKVRLNQVLRDKGLISGSSDAREWRAYLQSAGGSAALFVREGDEEALRIATAALAEAARDSRLGIEAMLEPDEIRRMRANPNAALMLEAREGYAFDESLDGELVMDAEAGGKRYATHGYSPDKPGYRCSFIAAGPGIRSGEITREFEMTDLAPTFARILGIEFAPCDGKVLGELFL